MSQTKSNLLKTTAIFSWVISAYLLLMALSAFVLSFGMEEKVFGFLGFKISGIIAEIFPLLLLILSILIASIGIKLWKKSKRFI